MQPNLSVKIGKLALKNPVMVASGTFGYAQEFEDFLDLSRLGAIVTKTITVNARQGNPVPRTCETPAGMLNSIGLENPGIDKFLEEKLPPLIKLGTPLIVSIASEQEAQEFVTLARRLDRIKEVAGIELNISCPNIGHKSKVISENTKDEGRRMRDNRPSSFFLRPSYHLISQDPAATYAVVKSVRKVTGKTLITKLSPNVADITEIAQAAEKAGSDAVSLINTLTGMSIDINRRKPKIACVTAGLSGPAIRPVAVRMVWEVAQRIKIPVIGMGGIMNTTDALEFILAGATAVSIGTANFINPKATVEIIDGLSNYLRKYKLSSIKNLIGSLECKI